MTLRTLAWMTIALFAQASVDGQEALDPPYPQSAAIAGFELDWSTHKRFAPGSDNFQLTWAADGNLYGAWGDGGGFGGTNSQGRVGFGIARIVGNADDYRGYNVWGGQNPENQATFDGKSWGMLSVESVLYQWVVPDHPEGKSYRNHYEYIELAHSLDFGATWTKADWRFNQSDDLTIPTFLNCGKDYRDVPKRFGDYAYTYFIHPQSHEIEHQGPNGIGLIVHKPGILYLARVPVDQIAHSKNRYEFFAGIDAHGQPTWGSLSEKRPVFEDRNGVGWCLSASYNPRFDRVIMATQHGKNASGLLGFFDAPNPWGPWTTIEYAQPDKPFGSVRPGSDLAWKNNVFFAAFPTKWLDGERFVLNFTGAGRGKDNDSFNTVEGRFIVPRTR